MVMNKDKQLFGVVEDATQDYDYTGVKTETAKVHVDNVKREISVTVDFASMLGETNKTAYPGYLGAQTRELVLLNIEDLENEIDRAKSVEETLTNLISNVNWNSKIRDNTINDRLSEEIERAKSKEQSLYDLIEKVSINTDENFENINKELSILREHVDESDKNLLTTISNKSEELSSQIESLSEDTKQQFEVVDNSMKEIQQNIVDSVEYIEQQIDETYQKTQSELTSLKKTLQEEVQTSISELKDSDKDIVDSIYDLEQHVIQSDAEIVNQISDIKKDYAEKTYVYEQLVEFTKLSKQLVKSVDLENNLVVIDENPVSPVDGVLYLLKDESASGQDIYKEYTTINQKLTLIGDTTLSLEGYATEEFVESKVNSIDLSPYAKKEDIPDVSEFITAIPSEYITEEELEDKSYLTATDINNLLNNIEFIDGGNAPL